MGWLVDGTWQDELQESKASDGKFVRRPAQFRNWVTADGSPGPSGTGGFKAEPGRYHLYVSMACPWAHRTVIFRKLKGLEDQIGVTVVDPRALGDGWVFSDDFPDDLYGLEKYYELYLRADAGFEDVHEYLPGEYGKQGGYNVIPEGLGAEQAEVFPAADADDTGYDRYDDERHDRHAQEPQKNITEKRTEGDYVLTE